MNSPEIFLNMSLLSQLRKPDNKILYDMLIIGGGPAAMSAAVYAARKMLSIAIITLNFGGLINETSEIENYLGFQNINARDLTSRFEEHVKSFDIPALVGVPVREVIKKDKMFSVLLDDGTNYLGKTVIFATGERHRKLTVPGEKEFIGKGVSYCATCDAPFFKEKKVLIVGGGNSAFTTALDLTRVNAEVILLNYSKRWKADKTLQQRINEYKKVRFIENHEIISIKGTDKVDKVIIQDRDTNIQEGISLDGIFIEIGLVPNSEPLKNLVEINEKGEVVVDCLCRTSIPGIFSAGDVTSVPYKQIIVSAGEGAKAALAAYDYLMQTSQI